MQLEFGSLHSKASKFKTFSRRPQLSGAFLSQTVTVGNWTSSIGAVQSLLLGFFEAGQWKNIKRSSQILHTLAPLCLGFGFPSLLHSAWTDRA